MINLLYENNDKSKLDKLIKPLLEVKLIYPIWKDFPVSKPDEIVRVVTTSTG